MKKLTRFLTLFVLISLVFVSGAFAVDTENEKEVLESIEVMDGVSRIYEDFEGESFSYQKALTQEQEGLKISTGSVPAAVSVGSMKFGHFRSVSSLDGKNTFGDWRFHEACETVNTSSDAYIAFGDRNYDVTPLSYQVFEFDMSTMTSYPSNFWIFSEWRDSNSGGKRRYAFGSYNDSDGLWHFGDTTLKIKKNEWVHVTIVIAIRCTDNGTTADYTASVGRIFINGELVNEIYPYEQAVISSSLTLRQHYLGVGWPYGNAGARLGMDDNSSVAIDNVALTRCQKEGYRGDLDSIFDEGFTDLTKYGGKEIIYDAAYSHSTAPMASATVEVGDQTLEFGSAQAAADYVKANKVENATLKLYDDVYHELQIDAPLLLDLNGHTLYNGAAPTRSTYLHSVEGDLWLFESASIFYANFEIFQAPYEKRTEPVATLALSVGESYTLPEAKLFTDAETDERYEPVGNWLLYDASGNVVEGGISKISEEHIGKHYVLCPVYTSPSVYFTVIDKNGNMKHYEDPKLLVGSNIPTGATVVLKRDIPYTNTISATDYSFDFNGYTVYCVDGKKPTLFGGSGTIYVYSSRPGARVFSGSYMVNGKTDEQGNPIYSNQAAFLLTDETACAGTKYMVGYRGADRPSPYRIQAYTAAFIQLSKVSNVSLYLCNFDVICNAVDNKGILTTRNSGHANRYWQIDNCDFIITNSKPLCSNVGTGVNVGTYVFNNSRIFGNGKLLGYEGSVLSDFSVTLNSTGVYGSHSINPGSFTVNVTENGQTVAKTFHTYVYLTGECYVSNVSETGCILPDGYVIIPQITIGSTSLFLAPTSARYSNFELGNTQYLGGKYSSTGYLGKIQDYAKLIRQSVAIDSSVNVLFFVPKNNMLTGAYLNGENILDPNDYRVIDGQTCYVIRISVAPKDAYLSHEIELTFRATSETVTMDASLMHYAQKLYALKEEGELTDYYADSKALMQYVLYYVRTAAKKLGGVSNASLAEIDGLLGSFALSSQDKILNETIHKTTSAAGALDAATLDLESKVGMVFKVTEGFVGTISVSMTGMKSEVRSYSADAPAEKNEYLILKNIPAHLLCSDVTVSITPASGTASTLYFNLATYVNGVKTDIAYAVYAYAKQASDYRVKYPTAFVLGD